MADKGWRSRKLWLAVGTMALVCAGYAATGFKEMLFGEFCMALLGAAGIYSGSSAAENIAVGRRHPKVESPNE